MNIHIFHIYILADEIYKICAVLGTPNAKTWGEGLRLASAMQFRFPQFVATPLAQVLPNASQEGIELLQDLLKVRRYVDRPLNRQVNS